MTARSQDGGPPDPAALHRDASAAYQADRPPDYLRLGPALDPSVQTCPNRGPGVAFLFEPSDPDPAGEDDDPDLSFRAPAPGSRLDILSALVEGVVPDSRDVLPIIPDGQPMSEQGLLDALARLHPEEAWQLLYILGPEGEGGGLGYRLVFHDSDAEAAELTAQIDRYLEGEADTSLPYGLRYYFGMERRGLEHRRDWNLNDWRFADDAKELHVYTWAEGEIVGDLWQDTDLTNRQGAEKLRALIGQHFNGEETFWQTTGRVAMGTGLIVFGTVDIVAGVSLATGGTAGTGGLGAAATVTGGIALTVFGADQIAQGTAMLVTPDPRHHFGPLGALIHHLGEAAGGETGAAIADVSYTVAQILVSLGATFRTAQIARANARFVVADGSVFRTLPNAPAQMQWRRFFVEDYPLNLAGDMASLTPSVVGRGMVVDFADGGRILIRNADAADETRRVLLRLRTLDHMAQRARRVARRLQMLGARMMPRMRFNTLEQQARAYGASVMRAGPSRFDEIIRAAGEDPRYMAAAFDNQSGRLILRSNATFYEGFHELQHARQWSELGAAAYNAQSRFQKEFYVFERITENAGEFSQLQLGHAGAYVLDVAYRTGQDAFRLPANFTRETLEAYYRFRGAAPSRGFERFVDRMFAQSRSGVP